MTRLLEYLDKALAGMAKLGTLHHIEFRQDIRVDQFRNCATTPDSVLRSIGITGMIRHCRVAFDPRRRHDSLSRCCRRAPGREATRGDEALRRVVPW